MLKEHLDTPIPMGEGSAQNVELELRMMIMIMMNGSPMLLLYLWDRPYWKRTQTWRERILFEGKVKTKPKKRTKEEMDKLASHGHYEYEKNKSWWN